MTRRSRWLAGAAAGALALLVGAVAVWNGLHSTGSGAPAAADAKRLSIVVLPFSNHTGDAGQDYFADGLTAALTADLSRIEDAFVIDSATAQSYRGKAQTAQQIGQALGVRFVLQGSVQRSGNQVRINTMLADSTTNKQLWSGSFDGETSNLFALQDQLTGRIANTMGRQIVVAAARESDKRGGAPQVVDLTLRARALEDKPHSLEKWEQVEQLYRQALIMDPGNVNVLAHLATALAFKTRHIRDLGLREKTWAEAIELSEKVIAIDPASPDPYRVLALRNLENDNLDAARRAAENYLRLGPRSPASYNVMGQVYSRLGELDKAVAMFRQAVDLSPAEVPAVFATNLGGAYFFQGNYRAAIDWNVRALQSEPNFWMAHLRLAMAYAMAGEESRARTEAAELLRLKPDFRIDVEKLRKEAENPARRALLEEKTIPAYRKAGLIE